MERYVSSLPWDWRGWLCPTEPMNRTPEQRQRDATSVTILPPVTPGHAGYIEMVARLVKAGYREHEVGRFTNADRFFQKRVEDNGVTLYFINAYLWDFSIHRAGEWVGVEYDVSLYRGERYVRVKISGREDGYSVQSAEAFIRDLYVRGGFEPDHNNQR